MARSWFSVAADQNDAHENHTPQNHLSVLAWRPCEPRALDAMRISVSEARSRRDEGVGPYLADLCFAIFSNRLMWLIAIVVPGAIIENLTMLAVLNETTLAVRRFLEEGLPVIPAH